MEKNIESRMLKDKQKYLCSTAKFSTRKQAFKAGWKAGFEYAKKLNSYSPQLSKPEDNQQK